MPGAEVSIVIDSPAEARSALRRPRTASLSYRSLDARPESASGGRHARWGGVAGDRGCASAAGRKLAPTTTWVIAGPLESARRDRAIRDHSAALPEDHLQL